MKYKNLTTKDKVWIAYFVLGWWMIISGGYFIAIRDLAMFTLSAFALLIISMQMKELAQ